MAIHPWQDLQTILSGFVRIASDSTLYDAVMNGEPVALSNYSTAIALADTLTRELKAILNGNGLGKFEGVPTCASWFGSLSGSARPVKTAQVPAVAGPGAEPKRQKTIDPAENERKKTLGMLVFDTEAAGTNRLPTLNVYHKKRGSRTPERVCIKFLTRGFSCTKPDCKSPHITNVEALAEPERKKFLAFVKNQPGFDWAEGKAPPGTA